MNNHLAALPVALEHRAIVGAAKDGCFSSATRRDYAVATAVVLATDGHARKTCELAADRAFPVAELAAEVSWQSGQTIVYTTCPKPPIAMC